MGGGGAFELERGLGAGTARALAFVLDTRRLNVGVSRAQCLAVLVAAPALADPPGAPALAQMQALGVLCRLLEAGQRPTPP